MKKIASLIFGGLFAGILSGNVAQEKSVDIVAERDARLQAIASVSEESPVCFSRCQANAGGAVNWHSSHSSHRSHSSHSSHYSHRSSF
jgi:hypothetical protein